MQQIKERQIPPIFLVTGLWFCIFADSDVEVFGPSSDSENEFSDEKVERLVAGGSVQFHYPGTGELLNYLK